jgi:hypothetical protein
MMQSLTQNFMYILGATLLFIVLSSKNILIYNEELLIVLSFVAFVVTCAHTMGTSIAETFETRATQIQDELQAFFVSKERVCKEIQQQMRVQQTVAKSIMALGALVLVNVETIHTQRAQAVQNTVQTQALTQIQHMMTLQNAVQAHMHTQTCSAYKHIMLEAMQMQKSQMQKLCMENALDLIGTMKRKETSTKQFTQTKSTSSTQKVSSNVDKKMNKNVRKPKKK